MKEKTKYRLADKIEEVAYFYPAHMANQRGTCHGPCPQATSKTLQELTDEIGEIGGTEILRQMLALIYEGGSYEQSGMKIKEELLKLSAEIRDK